MNTLTTDRLKAAVVGTGHLGRHHVRILAQRPDIQFLGAFDTNAEQLAAITGEHGVGLEKVDHMCVQFSEPELDQFRAIRKTLDPDGLLNPGKAIPTLVRCAEFGKMHVHHGELSFPELERF